MTSNLNRIFWVQFFPGVSLSHGERIDTSKGIFNLSTKGVPLGELFAHVTKIHQNLPFWFDRSHVFRPPFKGPQLQVPS